MGNQCIQTVTGGQVAYEVEQQINVEKFINIELNEPLQPSFSCKYYNLNDFKIWLYIVSITIISIVGILYETHLLLVSAIGFVLIQQRILDLLEVINVYDSVFSVNGFLIPFSKITNIKENGLKIIITYIDQEASILPTQLTFIKKHELNQFIEYFHRNQLYL